MTASRTEPAEPAPRSGPRLLATQEGGERFVIERRGAMRVPGVVFASPALFASIDKEALQQVANVATLPGIVEASYAMPDIHLGYGFPIGGVAATDVAQRGVISPGGVGFDISCGVRLLTSDLALGALEGRLDALMDVLFRLVPCGLGRGGAWEVNDEAGLEEVLNEGARAPVAAGLGREDDLSACEDGGALPLAGPAHLSARALSRGLGQLGSLGSGNHFLEVQVVEEVLDERVAGGFGLFAGQVCVMIHCGSRGLGHQVCSDHVRLMLDAMGRYGIEVPDRQLACAPVESLEGRAYLNAMAAATNYARANRQVLTDVVRRAFSLALGAGDLRVCYDVSHNLAKLEEHDLGGGPRLLCVHRKGATRALAPGHRDLPEALRPFGQPVLVPGSMGSASYVLVGEEPGGAFSSACHGAGRSLSRHAAARATPASTVRHELEAAGIAVRARSARGLAEESPAAYKDVDEVVLTCERAGLARRVARLLPIGVLKG
jgi:tRNA-splicing ligase RtcB